jgi:coproporphyrinogen III oxidase-like Fe-S oxidoreductase
MSSNLRLYYLTFATGRGCDILILKWKILACIFIFRFAQHRCSYCDFNTYAGQEKQIPDYVEALCREITSVAQSSGSRLPVHTIFFGGGTPSLLSPSSCSHFKHRSCCL